MQGRTVVHQLIDPIWVLTFKQALQTMTLVQIKLSQHTAEVAIITIHSTTRPIFGNTRKRHRKPRNALLMKAEITANQTLLGILIKWITLTNLQMPNNNYLVLLSSRTMIILSHHLRNKILRKRMILTKSLRINHRAKLARYYRVKAIVLYLIS